MRSGSSSPSLLTVTDSDLSFLQQRSAHNLDATGGRGTRVRTHGGVAVRHGARRGDGVRFRQDLRGHLRGDKEERRYVFFNSLIYVFFFS